MTDVIQLHLQHLSNIGCQLITDMSEIKISSSNANMKQQNKLPRRSSCWVHNFQHLSNICAILDASNAHENFSDVYLNLLYKTVFLHCRDFLLAFSIFFFIFSHVWVAFVQWFYKQYPIITLWVHGEVTFILC